MPTHNDTSPLTDSGPLNYQGGRNPVGMMK